MGWWGFTFPLGVYSIATTTIAEYLLSLFFKVLGTIFSFIVVLLWIIVSVNTLKGVLTAKLFVGPCLPDWEKVAAEREQKLKSRFERKC